MRNSKGLQPNKDGFKRRAIKQHKDLLTDPRYRHQTEASHKVRLSRLKSEDQEKEIKDYVNGQ